MAMNSRTSTEYLIPKKWQEMEISPEKPKIPTENNFRSNNKLKSVSVLYYISRNGHLDHPHFMEVPLSSSHGLYLRDVINRLDFLRGKGMANMYSWSSKRSYRNGFVWHDLSENDLIPPTQGTEYILKGSELLRSSLSFRYPIKTGPSEIVAETKFSGDNSNFPAIIKRRNRSWGSFDESQEYRVYSGELAVKSAAADASTQTGEDRRLRRGGEECVETTTELSRGETTPSSISSSEVFLGGVSGSRAVDVSGEIRDRTGSKEHHSGRMKASRVLMQLVSCGSVAVKDSRVAI
ncbi:hypothetical protein Vadar_011110 [Vaccinium darrowii]|uniref:Uncharacterized protein n=1 Tax=Vaccinium darrowii TaxID=229202 RepID=A0ACB7XGR2_9ERIC|nr:hypothetical protein Vadar_011110 [Vaccinium darrowii]